MKTYKSELCRMMEKLAEHPEHRFMGYNVEMGHKFYGTLEAIPNALKLEMPVEETLLMGTAIGMSLQGHLRPIVCFERANFLLPALDQLIHHMHMLPNISGEQFKLPIIIRVCMGSDTPLNPGKQHLGGEALLDYLDYYVRVIRILHVKDVIKAYIQALYANHPIVIVEYKDLYNLTEDEDGTTESL